MSFHNQQISKGMVGEQQAKIFSKQNLFFVKFHETFVNFIGKLGYEFPYVVYQVT